MEEQAFVEQMREAFPILQYFEYGHLPPHLQRISAPFAALAWDILRVPQVSRSRPEAAAGLRKLLEAKDCMVRAALPPQPQKG